MEIKDINSKSKQEKNLSSLIELAVHNLLTEKLPYDDLCGKFAKLILIIGKGCGKFSDYDVNRKKDEISNSSLSYDEICWLVSQLKIYNEQKLL